MIQMQRARVAEASRSIRASFSRNPTLDEDVDVFGESGNKSSLASSGHSGISEVIIESESESKPNNTIPVRRDSPETFGSGHSRRNSLTTSDAASIRGHSRRSSLSGSDVVAKGHSRGNSLTGNEVFDRSVSPMRNDGLTRKSR